MIAGGALRGAAITAALSAYEDAGVDELILDPTVADMSQVRPAGGRWCCDPVPPARRPKPAAR